MAISQILKKLVEQAPAILSKLTGNGDEAISPRDYLGFVRDISRANAASSKAIAEVSAASRAAAGVSSEVRHLHAHAVMGVGNRPANLEAADGSDGTRPSFTETPQARMERLLESYRRLSVPVVFDGQEDGLDEREEDDSEEGEPPGATTRP